MRIYKPQNELGQALLNEGQLVASSQKKTKTLQDGAITLTSSDVPNIGAWEVKNVMVTIAGTTMSFSPEVRRAGENIVIVFDDANSTKSLGFTEATIVLGLMVAQGFAGAEEEVQLTELEITILEAKESGDNSKIEEEITKAISDAKNGRGEDGLNELTSKLAASGIEEYALADVKNYDEFVAKATGQNMGAFSDTGKIATLVQNGELQKLEYFDETFSYNLANMRSSLGVNEYCGIFHQSNIKKFDGKLPYLTDSRYLFSQSQIEEFNGVLTGNCSNMFYGSPNIKTLNVSLRSLTNTEEMFDGYSCSLNLVKVDYWDNETSLVKLIQALPTVQYDAYNERKLCINNTEALVAWVISDVKEKGWVLCKYDGTPLYTQTAERKDYYGDNLTEQQLRNIMSTIPYGDGHSVTFHVDESLIDWTGWTYGASYWSGYYNTISKSIFDSMSMNLTGSKGYSAVYLMTNKSGSQKIELPVLC